MAKKITKKNVSAGSGEITSRCPYPVGGRPGYTPTEEELAYFTREYLDFVATDDCLKVYQFCHIRDVDENTFDAWAKRYPALQAAIEKAWHVVGDRREIMAIKGKADRGIILRTMAMYDKHLRKNMEWEASLRNREEDKNVQKIIVLERFPETALVPKKE